MPRKRKRNEESDGDRLARYLRIVKAYENAGLDWTQEAIGKSLSPPIGQAAVSAWRHVNPSIGYLVQIIRLTGCDGHWLLVGEGEPKRPAARWQSIVDQLPDSAIDEIRDRLDKRR